MTAKTSRKRNQNENEKEAWCNCGKRHTALSHFVEATAASKPKWWTQMISSFYLVLLSQTLYAVTSTRREPKILHSDELFAAKWMGGSAHSCHCFMAFHFFMTSYANRTAHLMYFPVNCRDSICILRVMRGWATFQTSNGATNARMPQSPI